MRAGIGLFDVLPLPYALANETGTSGVGRSELATLGSSSGLFASPPAGTWPYSVPTLASAALNVPLARSSWYYVDNNIKRNYVAQWNVNIQRQITPTLTVLVGYNGSRSVHNPMEYDSVNTIMPTFVNGVGDVYPTPWHGAGGPLPSATANAALLNPSIVTSSGTTEAGTMFQSSGWYEGMQVKVSKVMSRAFQVQGSFTYSKCIDDYRAVPRVTRSPWITPMGPGGTSIWLKVFVISMSAGTWLSMAYGMSPRRRLWGLWDKKFSVAGNWGRSAWYRTAFPSPFKWAPIYWAKSSPLALHHSSCRVAVSHP